MSVININGDELVTEESLINKEKKKQELFISSLKNGKESIMAKAIQELEDGLGFDLTGYELAGINFNEESSKWVKREGDVLHYIVYGKQQVPFTDPETKQKSISFIPYFDMYYQTLD